MRPGSPGQLKLAARRHYSVPVRDDHCAGHINLA